MSAGPTTPRSEATPWLIALERVDSTNTWALARWQALAHGAVVWTACQTAGRGRAGRTWAAPPGVLTCSVALHLPTDAGQLALAAGLAVAHACEDRLPAGRPVGIKWPNDLMVGGRKLAGILVERPSPTVAVVGIGLNCAPVWDDPDLAARCIGLTELGATVEAGPALAGAIRQYLLEAAGVLRIHGLAPLLPALRARDVLTGRTVLIEDGDRRLGGMAGGLDDHGRLVVDGQAIASGHVASW
jgi:BirA family biotin operon repressor/biotin-[acetyl-CoA-carboxylase] ligase